MSRSAVAMSLVDSLRLSGMLASSARIYSTNEQINQYGQQEPSAEKLRDNVRSKKLKSSLLQA
jgi:hypothetical protein